MVCDLLTPNEESRQSECSTYDSDYLRLVGYGGIMDTKYCGNEKVSIKVDGKYPLAMMFRSQWRSKRHLPIVSDLLNLFGFDCKLKCAGGASEVETTTSTTTSTSTSTSTSASTTTVNIEKIDEGTDFVVQPMGVTKKPKPTSTTTATSTTTTTTSTTAPTSSRCTCGGSRQGRVVCPSGQNCTAALGR